MSKTLLVVLEDGAESVGPYAISLGKTLGARLTAVWPRRDAHTDGSLEARLELARGDAESRKGRAREQLAAFGAAATAAGAEAEVLMPDEWQDPSRYQLAAFARAFDFTIIGQIEPGRAPTHDELAGQLLGESGRGVLVVPAIQREGAKLDKIVVGWDGSAAAARAFGDALPLLERARSVEIVSVVSSAGGSHAVTQGGERLARRLSGAGVEAAFKRLPSEEDAANSLLSYVADASADLLVAGGYSHSRLREALFGGVTRTFLASQTLPIFLSR